jgi:outer membrane receptor for ferrienterochelin and colicin
MIWSQSAKDKITEPNLFASSNIMKLHLNYKGFFTLAICLLPLLSFAQKVSIRGTIRETVKKEGLFGATIMIEGTTIGAQADFEGKFKLEIPANKSQTLVVRSVGFKTKTIPLQPIPAGEVRTLDVELDEDVKDSKEVMVTVVRRRDTDVSLISDIKKAEMVVNGVSSEQITRTQDRDAAQVMARVPGVTVIDNRFVMIRGINERYNSVMINDAISPGTEVDTRAFSFDLISSNMIERMMIYKSGAASLPGEFAGGVVKIYTKNTFGEDFFNVSVGTSLRPQTSFSNGMKSEGSSSDFIGFDGGKRTMPSSFPATSVYQELPASEQIQYAKTLNGNFGTQSFSTLPDLRLGINLGKRWNIGNAQLSTVSSINYTSTFQNVQTRRYRYASWNEALQKSQDTLFQYSDQSYSQNVRVSAISNWMYKTGRSRVEFKNLFNQMGDNETVVRTGRIADRSGDEFRNYSYNYLSRSLLSSQVLGNHTISEGNQIDWVAAYSYTNRSQPDYRRVRTFHQAGTNDPYQLVPAAGSGGLDETGRFFSGLKEHVATASVSWTHAFTVPWDSAKATFRTGTYQEMKSRDFQARFFAYILKNPGQNQDLIYQPLNQIFDVANLSTSKFVLEEGTRPQDSYQAQNFLAAGFAEAMVPFGKFKVIAGFRPEFNQQKLQSATSAEKINVNNPVLSPLGFFNASWDVSKQWVLRTAYSKTVNRPEFRELAPFVYYDFNLDANFVGNSDLKVADIHNVDFRAEFYPSKSELISVGAFYKYFVNPIETRISPVGLSPQFTYSNANSASNYGVEVEFRKALGMPGGDRLVDQLFFLCNASLIHSRVDLGVVGSQERIRSLQGQSPYVINGGFYYANEKKGLNVTAMYNVFGKRIFMVGDALFPSIYEMPRHVVDLTASWQVAKKVNIRITANDILNYQSRFVQDSNRDGKIKDSDELISSFRRGSYFSMGAIFNL